MLTKKKKAWFLTVTISLSLLWLGYQIYIMGFCQADYVRFTRQIIDFLGIRAMNKDKEWWRACTVAAYLQTLLHVLVAYCLFIKWPGKHKGLRSGAVVAVFAISLVTVPEIAGALFPNYRNILSPNHPSYFKVILIHGIVGMTGVFAAFAVNIGSGIRREKLALCKVKAMGNAVGRYVLTVLISFLIAVAYGFTLGILNHFNTAAVQHVLRSFSPDSKLISGIITMGIMAPLMEEMAFRGLIFTNTRRYSSTWFAVVFSSVVFGLWHRNLGQFIPTTIMGIMFSLIYLKSGKLRFAMLAHCLSNVFLAIAISSEESYLPEIPLLGEISDALLQVSLVTGIIGLLLCLGTILFLIYVGYPFLGQRDRKERN